MSFCSSGAVFEWCRALFKQRDEEEVRALGMNRNDVYLFAFGSFALVGFRVFCEYTLLFFLFFFFFAAEL